MYTLYVSKYSANAIQRL